MSIFDRLAWRSVRANRSHTLVTIIGVILASALISGVASFAVSLQSYMVAGATEKYGN